MQRGLVGSEMCIRDRTHRDRTYDQPPQRNWSIDPDEMEHKDMGFKLQKIETLEPREFNTIITNTAEGGKEEEEIKIKQTNSNTEISLLRKKKEQEETSVYRSGVQDLSLIHI
eukprot:TRINITY_DN58479_c0_g1_i2.p3 TRINITY_DN58479_c0_g1~~TRINITY_DN58479_c0_g1_i2.p3  ORF type:complete len:113 (-),score=33.27 TRINITY_DN58479_c0_g1_i2:120-458(-)